MVAHNLTIMAIALVLDGLIGDPDWLWRRLPHPVAWMGFVLGQLDRAFNRANFGHTGQMIAGAFAVVFLLVLFGGAAWATDLWLSGIRGGWIVTALLAGTLLAQRSLFDHVASVAKPLAVNDVVTARTALSRIVGRDVQNLDAGAMAGAAIESLAENLSDGVVAPLFWGCLLGLPGIVLYKAINTADSMIGHRTAKYLYFGRAAARLDDLVNLIPARLTGLLIAAATFSTKAVTVMRVDAGKHRSPNAGWPEAAMAGALKIRLSGPRSYHGELTDEPWLNPDGTTPNAAHLGRALKIMIRVCALLLAATLAAAIYFNVSGKPATTSSAWVTAAASA